MSNFVRLVKPAVVALILIGTFCFCSGASAGDDVSLPKASATRPAQEQPGQSSIPNDAPTATRTETTGAANPDATTAKMNEDAKKKLETEGK